MYLGWYDPDKKKKPERKLAEAIARYERKWGQLPSVALVNVADAAQLPEDAGVEVRVAQHVAPNTFFVGDDEPEEVALAA
ncbi:MAG: hypothetical protein WEC79_05810 [Thermomicrobiales bacterium]